MINTISIDSIEEIKSLIFEQDRNKDNGRFRSSFLYRGLPDCSFDLKTSLYRNCGDLAESLEHHVLDNYVKYVSIEDATINDSIWKAMIIGQHHGLPTRLLDWTHSPLVALHFATSEDDLNRLGERDCVVWRIDAREIDSLLPTKYRNALDSRNTFVFSVDHLSSVVDDVTQYDADMEEKAFVIVEPPSLDQRIVNQYSFFTIIPTGIKDLESFLDKHTENTIRYVIDKTLRWDLRDILDQFNVNERMIYPGKDGIAKWIARHYFVRNK